VPPYVAGFVLWTLIAEPAPLPIVPNRDVARAIERARADRALHAARKQYTASEFAECEEILEQAEARLRSVVERPSDFELLKSINLWLGLCQATGGDERAARRTFERALQLRGADPNPDLFPPQVMELVAAVERDPAPRCPLPDLLDGALVDGKRAVSSIEAGEHYAAGKRTGRFALSEDCELTWIVDPDPPAGMLTPREAADSELIARVQKQGVTLRARSARKEKEERPADVPWYQQHWWIWVVAGVAAVAIAVPTTYVLAREDDRYTLSF
jgi:hypothetical protein